LREERACEIIKTQQYENELIKRVLAKADSKLPVIPRIDIFRGEEIERFFPGYRCRGNFKLH
jgi:hypothetical protein